MDRSIRVSQLLREEISNMLLFGEIKDPRLKEVFITRVDVSKDLSNAKVYFKSTNEEDDPKEMEKVLNRASSFITGKLFKRLSLKKPVKLKFFYDDSDRYTERIDEILRKIHGESL